MEGSSTRNRPLGESTSDVGEARHDESYAALAGNWWAVAVRGVLAILFGVVALTFPGATILSLVLLFSAYAIVDGLFAIIAAVRTDGVCSPLKAY